nr:hypothetical protein [Tanacetum cinerariifolium]
MSAKDTIAVQRYGLSAKELNEFLSSYPIPSEYDVILPTSTQTIFDAPPGYVGLYTHSFSLANLRLLLSDFFCERLGRYPTSVHVFDDPILFLAGLKPSWEFDQQRPMIIMGEMAFRNFIYTEDDDDLAFLPKEPSSGFGTGSPSASVNTELPKDVMESEVQHAEIIVDSGESLKSDVFIMHPGSVVACIKERKCKTRGGSLRHHVKRKIASGSSSSHDVHAKTSASKDDAPILSISDDDEGKFPVHLVLSEGIDLLIHPLLSLYVLLGLPDCFERKDANASNERTREFLQVMEKMSGEANVIMA